MKQSYHHGNLETALIDAGIKLLSVVAAKDLSLRAVAKEAGVSHTAPYRHFKNKEALLEAIALEGFRLLTGHLDKAIDAVKGRPVEELIEAGLAYYDFALEHPQHLQVMFSCKEDNEETLNNPKIPPEYDAFGRLVDIFIRGQKAGVFTGSQSPQLLALAAWTQVHGYAILVIGGQSHAPGLAGLGSRELFRETGSLLYNGFRADD